jgi:hypothetical protein
MRLLAYRFGSGSDRRMVGVTSAADDGSCWSLWSGEFGMVNARRHNSAALCDEHVAEHLDALDAEGWVLDTRPVVMDAIDLPPDIDDVEDGREQINWAEHILTAASTMFTTMKTTTPSPYLKKLTIDVTFISPPQDFLDILTGGAL